uniref:hypothetical protein n=1 Tax=Pseudofabraea citricarpa TaxID=1664388 RepID=UPI0022FD8E91|nr:hypothetical protein PN052_mgp23 [Pseudofabraea citricarpa]WAX38804.1 hypothetical protein [Pseudofabraea citricarpa]
MVYFASNTSTLHKLATTTRNFIYSPPWIILATLSHTHHLESYSPLWVILATLSHTLRHRESYSPPWVILSATVCSNRPVILATTTRNFLAFPTIKSHTSQIPQSFSILYLLPPYLFLKFVELQPIIINLYLHSHNHNFHIQLTPSQWLLSRPCVPLLKVTYLYLLLPIALSFDHSVFRILRHTIPSRLNLKLRKANTCLQIWTILKNCSM